MISRPAGAQYVPLNIVIIGPDNGQTLGGYQPIVGDYHTICTTETNAETEKWSNIFTFRRVR